MGAMKCAHSTSRNQRRDNLKNGTIRKKGKIIMEIELIVQIGILGCLVYIIWFLRAFDVVNTKFWNTHYRLLEEIRDKD